MTLSAGWEVMLILTLPVLLTPRVPAAVASASSSLLHEAGASDVITALFGGVSSARAFTRQTIAQHEVSTCHGSRGAELTYGEFDLDFFWALLRAAAPRPSERFVDVGSGCGRLVMAAALAHDWQVAAGIELLGGLHSVAEQTHATLRAASDEDGIPLAPCRFLCEEAESGLSKLLDPAGDSAVVFVYASCWPSVGPYLTELSSSLAAVLPSGSRVITVDKQVGSSASTSLRQRQPRPKSCGWLSAPPPTCMRPSPIPWLIRADRRVRCCPATARLLRRRQLGRPS